MSFYIFNYLCKHICILDHFVLDLGWCFDFFNIYCFTLVYFPFFSNFHVVVIYVLHLTPPLCENPWPWRRVVIKQARTHLYYFTIQQARTVILLCYTVSAQVCKNFNFFNMLIFQLGVKRLSEFSKKKYFHQHHSKFTTCLLVEALWRILFPVQ